MSVKIWLRIPKMGMAHVLVDRSAWKLIELPKNHRCDQLLFDVAFDGLDEELAQVGGAGAGPG